MPDLLSESRCACSVCLVSGATFTTAFVMKSATGVWESLSALSCNLARILPMTGAPSPPRRITPNLSWRR